MNLAIVFKRPDGGVSITYPVEPMLDGEGEAQYLDRIEVKLRQKRPTPEGGQASAIPENWVRVAAIDKSALPDDRTFRAAWGWETPEQVIDIRMDRARAIYLDRLREVRDEKLAELDVEVIKNIGKPDEVAKIEAQKQVLRDLPAAVAPALEKAKTPEQLKAIQPKELKG